jgi:hypothetical protein
MAEGQFRVESRNPKLNARLRGASPRTGRAIVVFCVGMFLLVGFEMAVPLVARGMAGWVTGLVATVGLAVLISGYVRDAKKGFYGLRKQHLVLAFVPWMVLGVLALNAFADVSGPAAQPGVVKYREYSDSDPRTMFFLRSFIGVMGWGRERRGSFEDWGVLQQFECRG